MKSFKIIINSIIVITFVVMGINFAIDGFEPGTIFSWESWLVSFFYTSILTLINVYFFRFLDKKLDWKTQSLQRLITGISGSVVLTLIAYYACRYVLLGYMGDQASLTEFFRKELLLSLPILLPLIVIISLFFHLFFLYKYSQDTKFREQKIIAGTASAKFDALKNQLDPHFLFNSLNVLTSLIDENTEQAQNFTTSLSKVYRYVLEQKDKELVPVGEELDFAKTYIGLLKMRFENGIQFEIPEAPSNPEAKIVPLSLQLLLENAVKHNRVSEGSPLRISIFESDDELVVKNNVQKKKTIKKSSGIGLSNIKQRFGLLTAREVSVREEKEYFEVRLPVLTKQVAYVSTTEDDEFDTYDKIENARKKLDEIRGFYGNLTAYCIIIPVLALINVLTSSEFLWFFFPMIGWGTGVFFHYVNAFDKNPFYGRNWEERKIRQYMEKEDKF